MKKIDLIDKNSEAFGLKVLETYYKTKIIPPEKKQYLADLKNSVGPYMGIESSDGGSHYMMDAASQIATLGLGFNSLPFFAPTFHSESYTNNHNSKKFQDVRKSFESFLKRKLEWSNVATTFCHSGAEANEIALGYCYRRRVNKSAKKVLAFEGSFHGRMLISLSSTWNKTKRAPFEWSDYLTEFVSFPNTKNSDQRREFSINWLKNWENSPSNSFDPNMPPSDNFREDEWELEKKSLIQVKEKLSSGEIFAIIIEPMQCEGGDQYATNRFFNALTALSQSYDVPIIFDEVQTGYHLGDDFFWHKQFELINSNHEMVTPDYLVCAKKAQIGMVISHCDEKSQEEFSVASFFRGYAHAISLDNSHNKILKIKETTNKHLYNLMNKFKDYIENPRGLGLCFAFDLKEKELVPDIIKLRFDFGLLYYPAGERTLRFRLNTGFRTEDIEFLFHQLESLLSKKLLNTDVQKKTPPRIAQVVERENSKTYKWINLIYQLKNKIHSFKNREEALREFNNILILEPDERLLLIDSSNIDAYLPSIQDLQKEVYEPSRQTSDEVFKKCATANGSVCLIIEKQGKVLAMSFSAPALNFKNEKGLSDHEEIENINCLYTTDTTISPSESGKRRGRDLKFASISIGLTEGKNIFIGRNRYQLASSMMDINLALGGHIYKFSRNDYNDNLKPNDVIHYKIDFSGDSPNINLSNQNKYMRHPKDFIKNNDSNKYDKIASINNKICLSNFVGSSFLNNINKILNLAPKTLRHGYTTSGQSECVDKIVKSIWNKNKSGQTSITFEGHYFGNGSFLSRSVSSIGDDFFKKVTLPHPTVDNIEKINQQIEEIKRETKILGIWLEPIGQRTGHIIPEKVLTKIVETAKKCDLPVIFNETGSKCYAFSSSRFYAAGDEIAPDAIMTYHGGQLGTVNISEEFFMDKPLMLISTWDGDEFSANLVFDEIDQVERNKEEFLKLKNQLHSELETYLKARNVSNYQLKHSVGFFESTLTPKYRKLFNKFGNRIIVNPSYSALKNYFGVTQ